MWKSPDGSHIAAAVAAAEAADVAVVFVGSDQSVEAENFDRTNITMVGLQNELVAAVAAANPKTVVVRAVDRRFVLLLVLLLVLTLSFRLQVLINGGPLDVSMVAGKVGAIVESFYPGQMGGDAIVSTLTGASNRWGRTPYTTYFQVRGVPTGCLPADSCPQPTCLALGIDLAAPQADTFTSRTLRSAMCAMST